MVARECGNKTYCGTDGQDPGQGGLEWKITCKDAAVKAFTGFATVVISIYFTY